MEPSSEKLSLSAIFQSVGAIALFGLVLFASAGTFNIPAFWPFLGSLTVVSVVGLLTIDPDLARERMRPGGKRLSYGYTLLILGLLMHLMVAGLDRGRFHWSDSVPLLLQIAALILFTLAGLSISWAMYVNRFFSSVPRIQTDRGQRVISDGPYRWVRHPGYVAGLILTLTSGLALGSWFAAAIGLLGVPLLLQRTAFEDRLLNRELAGYTEYASRVRYRLIPGIW